MEPLYMIQCTLDPRAFMAFAREQNLDPGRDELDLGYLGHAWLKAAFGELAPAPWRLFMPRRSMVTPPRILAYSSHPVEALADHLDRFGTPSVAAVCPSENIQGKTMPTEWPMERRYGFEVLCCPVGRKAGKGPEKDIYLIRADHSSENHLDRLDIYRHWFRERLHNNPGVQVVEVEVDSFRLGRILRKTQNRKRKEVRAMRPQAVFRGLLEAKDSESLLALLQRGVGRHRAFGFGMVLLRPA